MGPRAAALALCWLVLALPSKPTLSASAESSLAGPGVPSPPTLALAAPSGARTLLDDGPPADSSERTSPPNVTAAGLQTLQDWVSAERRARRWRRTSRELDNFVSRCSWIADGWVRAVRHYDTLDKVIVFDVRHGTWVGLGDSISRHLNFLRLARALGRAGFILSDPCADPLAPRRLVTTRLSRGTTCEFDLAAYVRGLGPSADYQWSETTHARVERRHGLVGSESERVVAMLCKPGPAQPCELRDARTGVVLFSTPADPNGGAPLPGHELSWFQFLLTDPELSAAPWIRIELTDIGDFFFLYEQQEVCRAAGINIPPWWDQARPSNGESVRFCSWSYFPSALPTRQFGQFHSRHAVPLACGAQQRPNASSSLFSYCSPPSPARLATQPLPIPSSPSLSQRAAAFRIASGLLNCARKRFSGMPCGRR